MALAVGYFYFTDYATLVEWCGWCLEPTDDGGFSLRDAEREQLRRAIRAADGDREHAARLIGVSRATIYRKIRDLGLKGEV